VNCLFASVLISFEDATKFASSEGGNRASWNCCELEEESEDAEEPRERGAAHEGGMGVSSVGDCGGFMRSGLAARVDEALKLMLLMRFLIFH
jgi:hypothetical protein